MMKFRIVRPLGQYGDADPQDIHAVKTTLNQLGYYIPPRAIGIEETREPALFAAINAFQRDHGIVEGNYLIPHDPTIYALDAALKKRDATTRYIWRTAGDARVRDSHAVREGGIFVWGQPPEGGHPGDDYNCRCWAELISDVEKEELVPPKIPGTNIPDKGISEDGVDPDKRSGDEFIDPDMEIKPPLVDPYMPMKFLIPDFDFRWRR